MWSDPRRTAVLRAAALIVVTLAVLAAPAAAQCRPASERTGEVGCWIIAREPLGPLAGPAVFWHLHTFASRAEAEAEKGPRSTVIEAVGFVWLSTVGEPGWRPRRGIRVAEIGPLAVEPGRSYTAQYLEGIFDPGMTTEVHSHPGPEAVYTTEGAICFETPDGTVRAGAGEAAIMPAGRLHTLTATGTARRRSLAVVVHESDRPWRLPSSDWSTVGRCKP
ncbi:MAG TPA: cupin domain-containing protein [Verrucomicrobiae bacterium]|jgi:quercetin dioxygenase-like cupin family protein|nr:cupin domain-containing protein [Verrucomicrobiae bacterium]